MIELKLLELFARGIPEGLLFILSTYVITRTAFNARKYLLSSMLYAALVYLIRMLPIQFGITTLITIVITVILNVTINEIDSVKSIQATIITIIMGFLSEGVSIFMLEGIFKVNIDRVFDDAKLKILYGIPSQAILGIMIFVYYLINQKRKCSVQA